MTWSDSGIIGQGHTLLQVCGGKSIHVDAWVKLASYVSDRL